MARDRMARDRMWHPRKRCLVTGR